MTSIKYQEILTVAKNAAQKAGAHIRTARQKRDVSVSYKGTTDLVTQYDTESETIIIDEIKRSFPTHALLTEETNSSLSTKEQYHEPLWIVDPIDGTTNFAHGHYQVSVSIGFALKGRYRVGVVYNPFLEEMFTAIEGEGAYRNGEKIHCSNTTDLRGALIVTGFPYNKDEISILLARIKAVLLNCRELRRLGSGALDICWVADGRMCGYYESLNPWDVAAGIVVAREAGVIAGHINPIPESWDLPPDFYTEGLLFANPVLFPKLQKLLSEAVL